MNLINEFLSFLNFIFESTIEINSIKIGNILKPNKALSGIDKSIMNRNGTFISISLLLSINIADKSIGSSKKNPAPIPILCIG